MSESDLQEQEENNDVAEETSEEHGNEEAQDFEDIDIPHKEDTNEKEESLHEVEHKEEGAETDMDSKQDENVEDSENSGGILQKIGNLLGGGDDEDLTETDTENVRELDITVVPFTEGVEDNRSDELGEQQERVGFGVEIIISKKEWSQINGSNVVHGLIYDTTSDLAVDGGENESETIGSAEQIDRDGDKVLRHWIDSRVIDLDEDSIEPSIEYQTDGSALVWIWTTDRTVEQSDIEDLQLDVSTGSESELADELQNYVSGNSGIPDFDGHLRTPTIRKIEFDETIEQNV